MTTLRPISSIWAIGMTFSNSGPTVLGHGMRWITALLLLTPVWPVWAGLGDAADSVNADRIRMHAHHSVAVLPQYAVHDLQSPDGARIQQFVGGDGKVFAVVWHTLSKPDLSGLLGSSYPSYSQSAREAAQRAGIQRRFRHVGMDVVVQSTAHLNVFSGYAFRQSLLPPGFSPQRLELE